MSFKILCAVGIIAGLFGVFPLLIVLTGEAYLQHNKKETTIGIAAIALTWMLIIACGYGWDMANSAEELVQSAYKQTCVCRGCDE